MILNPPIRRQAARLRRSPTFESQNATCPCFSLRCAAQNCLLNGLLTALIFIRSWHVACTNQLGMRPKIHNSTQAGVITNRRNSVHQKENKKDWLDALKRQLQTCPHCGQHWLIVGVENGEEHPCRDCGQRFVIKLAHRPNDWSPNDWSPNEQQCNTGRSRLLQAGSAVQAAAK
jgi:DNA-directed RNA polymerase subunit RPC12/RpoP